MLYYSSKSKFWFANIYIYIYIYIAIVDALKKQYYFVFVGNLLHLSVPLALV